MSRRGLGDIRTVEKLWIPQLSAAAETDAACRHATRRVCDPRKPPDAEPERRAVLRRPLRPNLALPVAACGVVSNAAPRAAPLTRACNGAVGNHSRTGTRDEFAAQTAGVVYEYKSPLVQLRKRVDELLGCFYLVQLNELPQPLDSRDVLVQEHPLESRQVIEQVPEGSSAN